MSENRKLWKVIIFDEECERRTEWVVADVIDEVLSWINQTSMVTDEIHSVVCKGEAEVLPENYLAQNLPEDTSDSSQVVGLWCARSDSNARPTGS